MENSISPKRVKYILFQLNKILMWMYKSIFISSADMDVISIPVKNYIIASIGILNCELLWIFIY